MASLVELGDRYWALGLPAAARGAFTRALTSGEPGDPVPIRRLAELALAVGDAPTARKLAADLVKREPGAAARVLLGQAQLAAGEIAAARMSFTMALDAPTATPAQRARARLGLAAAAQHDGDAAGADANAMAAYEDLIGAMLDPKRTPAALVEDCDRDAALFEEVVARIAGAGRGADARAALDAARDKRPDAPLGFWRGLLLSALQAHGDHSIADDTIEALFAAEVAARPHARVVALRLIERRLRRRLQDASARQAAIAELTALAQRLESEASPEANVELARVWFLLAAVHEDEPATRAEAETAYRKGLRLRPGHAEAACRLALLILDRGDTEAALGEIERALRIDAGHGMAWRNAAR
ncbi:MAG TPA: tetratricopeptide repeat protein, partial [Kofleriaceae bacterium]|nr:tetratricopeptide repeat protein [Kofleriaceae bacterium]